MKFVDCYLFLIKFAILAQCHADVIFERIKNGRVVSGEDFSFTARIDLNGKQVCNGVLINNGWISTDKTCIDKKKLANYEIFFSSIGNKETDVVRTITDIKTADKKNNDIILLKLNDTVLAAVDKVKPLGRFSTKKLDKKMKNCKAIGFSENGQQLVELTVSLKKTSKCKGASSKKNVCFDAKKGSLCKNFQEKICVPFRKGKSMIYGVKRYIPNKKETEEAFDSTILYSSISVPLFKADNGSPVVCIYKTKWYLVGTVLVAKGCSQSNIKGALVSFYGKAIQKVLNDKDKIDCGSVPRIENRRAELVDGSTKFGSKARVSCVLGYKTDKVVIKCQTSGKWETSTCVKIGCGPPPNIAFANVISNNGSTVTGSLAEVQCFPGYKTNVTTLKCKVSDDWETTTCEEIENFDYRLPNDMKPIVYDLELQPDFYNVSSYIFTGYVSIYISCMTDTSIITLNMKDLVIKGDIEVKESSENLYKRYEYDSEKQFLYVQTQKFLTAGTSYTLNIKFSGGIGTSSEGLFSGLTRKGKDIFVASKLGPIYARRVFPCLDEPSYKSSFGVTLVRKEPMMSLFNTPIVKSEKREDGWIADTFRITPDMSTYNLAFLIKDFDYVEKNTTNDVMVRVFAESEAVNDTQYALDTGVKIIPFFEDYFKSPYKLPKQDIVALSKINYNSANLGLITIEDRRLLVDIDDPSDDDKEYAASVVARDLAQVWFGNHVTADWWTELWLNKGFAKYFEYIAVDSLHPEWRMNDMYVKKSLQRALDVDSGEDSIPLQNEVTKPDEIISAIDETIPAHKGAAIVRMLRFLVGDNTFQKGLQKYIKDIQILTAKKEDLWSAMTEQATIDENSIMNIKDIMNTWVLQKNYPVVKVEFSEEGKITLTQSRFTSSYQPSSRFLFRTLATNNRTVTRSDQDDSKKNQSPYGYKWIIPFTYATSSTKKFDVTQKDIFLMRLGKDKVTIKDKKIPKPQGKKWVIGNPKLYGYYRVNYDNRNWNALADQLISDHSVFPVSNRAQLISDAWTLQSTGNQRLFIALRTIEYLDDEKKWLPWATVKPWLQLTSWNLDSNAVYNRYKKFMRSKTSDLYEELVQKTSKYTLTQSKLKDIIIEAACWHGLPSCVIDALQDLEEWKADPQTLTDANFLEKAYCSAIAAGSQDDWEFVLAKLNESPNGLYSEKRRFALTCTTNISNVNAILEMISNEELSIINSINILIELTWNPSYRIRTWEYITVNWDFLLKRFFRNIGIMSALTISCSESLNTVEDLESINAFKKARKEDIDLYPQLQEATDKAIANINTNIDWVTNNIEAVIKWLKSQGL